MIKTAQEHSTISRLVVVASGVHYWTEIPKGVSENPDMLKTFGSAEYCTDKYAARLYTTQAAQLNYLQEHV
jgi:hypothetical protein